MQPENHKKRHKWTPSETEQVMKLCLQHSFKELSADDKIFEELADEFNKSVGRGENPIYTGTIHTKYMHFCNHHFKNVNNIGEELSKEDIEIYDKFMDNSKK